MKAPRHVGGQIPLDERIRVDRKDIWGATERDHTVANAIRRRTGRLQRGRRQHGNEDCSHRLTLRLETAAATQPITCTTIDPR